MKNDTTICIDLAKEVFQVAVFNRGGKALINKAMSSRKMIKTILEYPGAKIYMEACGSAHYWGRYFVGKEFEVGLIPPHIAARYRTGNKSDKNDVLAIFEASKNPKIHSVSIRTVEQQDIALLHKQREGYKKERNQVANRIRGFAREYGVHFANGIKPLLRQVPEALEDAENELSVMAREMLSELLTHLRELINRLDHMSHKIETYARTIEPCRRLVLLPGISWLVASMLYAKLGNAQAFLRGRDASASIGIVPAHSGSGGKVKIGSITKRGDVYLRSLLVNGARSVVSHIQEKADGLSCWIRKLLTTKNFNQVVIAVANKVIRMACAMLKSGDEYRQPVAQA
jgi:transposase